MLERCPNLRWVFFDKGAKSASFQRHVIIGFTKVDNPKYNADCDLVVATYAQRLVSGLEVEADLFVKMVRDAEKKA